MIADEDGSQNRYAYAFQFKRKEMIKSFIDALKRGFQQHADLARTRAEAKYILLDTPLVPYGHLIPTSHYRTIQCESKKLHISLSN